MNPRVLVVIPSEPLHLYEKKGIYTWLERYYNPAGFFDKVYLLSPLETEKRFAYGMEIIPITSVTQFKQLVKEIHPVCVRTYGAYWATSYGVINRIKGIPVVASIHDSNPAYIFKGIKRASFVFSMSQKLTSILEQKGIEGGRVISSGNRVDFELFKKIAPTDLHVRKIRAAYPKGKMLLHIGRITEQKNLKTVISALEFLPEDYFLVFIGRGVMPEINKQIIDLNLEHRIFNVLTVPNSQLPYWFNACDVFVTPSLWEGFGVVFLEAAACQTRLVTSDIKPLNEFLTHDGDSVTLVQEYTDPKAISQAVVEILKEDGSSTLTYDFIKNRYAVEAIEKIEIDFYKKIISGELQDTFLDDYWGRKRYEIVYKFSSFKKSFTERLKESTKLKLLLKRIKN